MLNKRHHARYDCDKPCQMYLGGASYQVTIKNVSVVAMGLHFEGEIPDVEIGDDCLIYLYGYKGNPCEINYKVIRIDNYYIAVGSSLAMLTN